MHMLLSRIQAHALPAAIGAAVALLVLFGAWKLVKGVAKLVVLLILVAAVACALFWVAKGGTLPH
jgi:hypothetical protein